MRFRGVAVFYLCVLVGSLAAETSSRQPAPTSQVIARSGGHQLTEQMLQQALLYGQIQAGVVFSPSDAAALRRDLIAYFEREPAKQAQEYEAVGQFLRANNIRNSFVDYAVMRYKQWKALGEDPQAFRDFGSVPFGKMVLKYNPVLANSGGMIITQRDVDWQFTSDEMVAKIAGVAAPTQADKEQYVRSLPAKFASMPKDQQEYLRASQVRFANVHMDIDDTIKTRAAVEADIRKNVHSSRDVWREARQVENDSLPYSGKYYYLWHTEMLQAVFHGQAVVRDLQGIGKANENVYWKSQVPPLLSNGAPAH